VRLANDRLRVITTSACNLDCFYCHNEGQLKGSAFMPWGLFDAVMTAAGEAERVDEVTFSGGEPLMHPQIVSMVDRAKALAPRRTLVTNGTLLTENLAAHLYAAGLSRIRLGVDSLRPLKPRPSKGFLSSPLAVDAVIEMLARIGLEVDLNVVITRFNARELGDIASLAIDKNLNVKFFEHVDVTRFGHDGSLGIYGARPQVPFDQVFDALARQVGLEELAPSADFGDANLSGRVRSTEIRYCRYLCPFRQCWRTGTRVDAEGYVYTCMSGRGAVQIQAPWNASSVMAALSRASDAAGCPIPT